MMQEEQKELLVAGDRGSSELLLTTPLSDN